MAKALTILLLSAPYSSQYVDIALKMAERALDRGYDVNLFLYADGVHLPKKGQKGIEERLSDLVGRGLRVKACLSCALARGYTKEDVNDGVDSFPSRQYVDGVLIASIFDFAGWLKNSDKVVSLGG